MHICKSIWQNPFVKRITKRLFAGEYNGYVRLELIQL